MVGSASSVTLSRNSLNGCSSVILEDLLNDSLDRAVGFYFFKTSDSSHDLAEQTLRLITRQLYAQLRAPSGDLRQLIERGLWGLDLGILLSILKKVISLHRSVYIVLNALNAVDATVSTVMSRLIQDFDKQGSRVQLIAMSRFNLNVEEALLDINNRGFSSRRNCVAKSYLHPSDINFDIRRAARGRFEGGPWSQFNSSKVADALTLSSDGL